MISDRPLTTALLRDVPEEDRISMERFATELAAALTTDGAVNVKEVVIHESPWPKRVGLGRLEGYRCRHIVYPLVARRTRADIYHLIDQGYGHVAALLPPERVVATCHDLMSLCAQDIDVGFQPARHTLRRYKWSVSFLRRFAKVVCVSQATRRDVSQYVGVAPERLAVIPPGINERFRPERLLGRRPQSSERTILHVSSGNAYKNVEGTLRVLRELRLRQLNVRLVRIGRPMTSEQRSVARDLGVRDAIVELGRVSDVQLVEAYNSADVLLFPSLYEGFGWPVLEAMACGLPVVISQAPSLLEIAGEGVLSAPVSDIRGLTNAVAALIESNELASRVRAYGLQRAELFRWDRVAASYREIYCEVVKQADRPNSRATARRGVESGAGSST